MSIEDESKEAGRLLAEGRRLFAEWDALPIKKKRVAKAALMQQLEDNQRRLAQLLQEQGEVVEAWAERQRLATVREEAHLLVAKTLDEECSRLRAEVMQLADLATLLSREGNVTRSALLMSKMKRRTHRMQEINKELKCLRVLQAHSIAAEQPN